MLYFASDIHANYGLFMRLLEKIKFSSADEMIICGDIVEKGPESIRLARLVFQTPNILCIRGNHEYNFLKRYWALMKEDPEDYDEALRKLQAYFPEDGHLLDWDTVDGFEALPCYIEREDFVCVHAGMPLDGAGRFVPWEKVPIEHLMYDRTFYQADVLPRDEKCVFFGHTPTSRICGTEKILTYPRVDNPQSIRDFYKVHLDMGTMTSGVVGCINMDTGEDFYVKRTDYEW